MDSQVEWKVSDDVDSLIETVLNCKRELTKCCFAKFGAARIVDYKVSAPQKICDFLLLADGHKPTKDKSHDSHCHKIVTQFDQFNLFKTKMFGDSTIRVEAIFDIGEGMGKFWYGNITLT
jgi:hypothetical protein